MTSTNHTTIATRIGQGLAVTALMAGIAFGATPIASAKPMDWDSYNRCLIRGGYVDECCIMAGGDPGYDNEGYPVNCAERTTAGENVPQEPGPTEPPPVLDPGQIGPSNPLIPTPRGPNSGTLAP